MSDEEQHKFKEQANKLAEESKAREEAEMRAAAARQPPPTQFHKDMFPQPNQQQFGQNQPILPQPDNAQGFPGQQRIVPMQSGKRRFWCYYIMDSSSSNLISRNKVCLSPNNALQMKTFFVDKSQCQLS